MSNEDKSARMIFSAPQYMWLAAFIRESVTTGREDLAEELAQALYEANPKFDRIRFLRDCGVELEVNIRRGTAQKREAS